MSETVCLLHTRQYRAALEELVNKLEAAIFQRHQVIVLRSHQGRVLCTCSGLEATTNAPSTSACAAECNGPNHAHLPNTASVSPTSRTETKTPGTSSSEGWAGPPKLSQLDTAIRTCQTRLRTLATKRGQLSMLEPAINDLYGLVRKAFAAPAPEAAKAKAKSKTAGGRIAKPGWRPRARRGFHRPVKKVVRPPQPYAPLRWPPLRVTLAAVRGQPLPGTTAAASRPHGWQPPAQRGSVSGAAASVSSGLDEEFCDLAEQFEEKLQLVGHKSHHKAGRLHGGHGRVVWNDVLSGAAAAAPHQLGEPSRQLERARKRDEKLARKRAARQPKLRDSERTLGCSKCGVYIGQLWPYK